MLKETKDKSFFLAFCIEQYKQAKDMSGTDVAEMFFATGLAAYLTDNFEVLHTQSHQWIIEEIDEYLERRNEL